MPRRERHGCKAEVDIAVNNIRAGTDGPLNVLTSSLFSQWGWTAGIGLEYALSGNWSVELEYDYLGFGPHGLETPAAAIPPGGLPGVIGSSAPDGRGAGISQAIQALKLGVNYRFGDRDAPGLLLATVDPMSAAPFASAFQIEFGTRYVHGWGRYQQDLVGSSPLPVDNSRLTWTDLQTNGAEFFGRVTTPQRFVVKGLVGGGTGNNGHMNDEDWGLQQPFQGAAKSVFPYQNSLSGASDNIRYFTIDAGYDWFHQPAYTLTPFIGYSYLEQHLETPKTLNYIMYSPAASADTLGLGQSNFWRALRLGAAADIVLAPRLHLNAEAAYLPYVHYRGQDDHGPGAVSPQWGNGDGVRLEAILSYDLTDRFNVGLGGRYWAFWIPNGQTSNFATGGTGEINAQSFSAEQAALFVQASYKFGLP